MPDVEAVRSARDSATPLAAKVLVATTGVVASVTVTSSSLSSVELSSVVASSNASVRSAMAPEAVPSSIAGPVAGTAGASVSAVGTPGPVWRNVTTQTEPSCRGASATVNEAPGRSRISSSPLASDSGATSLPCLMSSSSSTPTFPSFGTAAYPRAMSRLVLVLLKGL